MARLSGGRLPAVEGSRIALGALLAGITADTLGLAEAMWVVAAITCASGVVVAVRLSETVHRT
jgi:predicted MFS family arabinose efflux permease